MSTRCLKAAGAYVARGLKVFPLNGKVPVTEHGVKDASDSPAQLERWFGAGERNIAVAIPEGVIIVDIDPRNGGRESWVEWLDMYGDDPWLEAPCALTGGNGYHFWFRLPEGVEKLKKNPADGIDLLTVGRYVVAAPSVTDNEYKWEKKLPHDLGDLPELPGWIAVLASPDVITEDEFATFARSLPATGDALADAARKMTTWEQLLMRHGWKHVGGDKWRHPNSHNPFSATIRHDCLFVYSPNTKFDRITEPGNPQGYTLFSALEVLDYNGDRKALLQALRDAGYLDEREPLPKAKPEDVFPVAATKDEVQSPKVTEGQWRLGFTDMQHVPMKRVRWLWHHRMPLGGLTLLAGREGGGKSTIAIDMMAKITKGTLEGECFGTPHGVVFVATEDSIEYTIKPRLVAAGANLERVFYIVMAEPTAVLELPVHLPDLEAMCREHDIALIVMDPLLSRLSGNLDSHKDADVRRALEPLVAFAERLKLSILGLIHLNKSGATDPLQAIMASKAFTAVARAVLFAMVNPDNEAQRLLGLVKSNLGPLDEVSTLTYTFDPIVVGEDDGPIIATRIAWGSESSVDIRSALEAQAADLIGGDRSAVAEAGDYIREWLEMNGGEGFSGEILRDAKAAGYAERTVRRAFDKDDMLERKRVGNPPKWLWRFNV